jgi:hypothetical protein
LPQLEFLAAFQNVDELLERPLAILLDDSLHRAAWSVEAIEGTGASVQGDILPCANIKNFKEGVLECELCFHTIEPPIAFTYSITSNGLWKQTDVRDVRILLEYSDSEIFEGTLEEYLEKFPPSLVMPNGGIIMGRQHLMTKGELGPLRKDCFQVIDWTGCDVNAEKVTIKPGLLSIHDWLQAKLAAETSTSTVVFKDDSTGEMADFIVVDPISREVRLYHCKGMAVKHTKPGNRVDDAYEVLGQACRSDRWAGSPGLMEEIYRRTQERNSSNVTKGKSDDLKKLAESYNAYEWKYKVIVVQPAFDCKKILLSKKSTYSLIVTTDEWLKTCDAELTVWGS